MTLLALNGVSKSYGHHSTRVHVLRSVTINVEAGQTVWLRGESGSGKSSLLRVAGLLSTPDSGTVEICGAVVTAAGSAHRVRRQQVGLVFQHGNLLPDLTVADNIAIASSKPSEQKINTVLQGWGLAEIAGRKGKEISGGQAQRVAICRALINDPVVLLADEPTAGLDPANGEKVLAELSRARSNGRAIVVASHDPAVEKIADRILMMKDGQVV